MKLQRNALSVLEHPTGNENDEHDLDNSSCSSDIGEKDNDFCKSLKFWNFEILEMMGMGLHVPKSFHFLSKVDFILHYGEKLNSVTIHGQLAALFSTNSANQKWGRLSHGLHLHQQSQLVGAAMEKFNLFTCQSQGRWDTLKPTFDLCVCARTLSLLPFGIMSVPGQDLAVEG